MKQSVLALGLVLLATCPTWADEPAPLPAEQSAKASPLHPEDETAAIRDRVEAYVAAYNKHDAAALADLWADDAVYLNHSTGESVQGRAGIAAMFEEMFKAGEADQLSVTVDSIRLITPDVAIEDGKAELAPADGEPVPSTYTAVHVKKDGKWYLTSVRETEVPSATEASAEQEPSNPLDELAWMVGEWVDQDDQATVRTRCDWAKSGRFLTSNFEVNVDGAVALEGTQVIAWDPVAQSIRSWMFDSEGGFGEGLWSRSGDQWTVETRSTQADGSQATASNVYTVLDDKTFTWRSANRQVDGEPQPEIEEVPVYRQ
ncbi:MAG TPA: SgcJ/EcaC family oxidoreductase [Lacipirellula sp.]